MCLKDTQKGYFQYEAFKQFVTMYDKYCDMFKNLRLVKYIVNDYKLDESFITLGRSYLFTSDVSYLGVSTSEHDSVKKVKSSHVDPDVPTVVDPRLPVDKDRKTPKSNLFGKSEIKGLRMHVFSDMIVFQSEKHEDIVDVWHMFDIKSVRIACTENRPSKSTFIIDRYIPDKKINLHYYFYRGSNKGKDEDMPSLVERIKVAIESHSKRDVFAHDLNELGNDCNICCDGIPRSFIHAIAWILANDMRKESPFSKGESKSLLRPSYALAVNGYMPLFSDDEFILSHSYVPESLFKIWLKDLRGCSVDFTEEWFIKDKTNPKDEIAERINTKMKRSQLKMLAVIVEVIHCIWRHREKTKFSSIEAISTLFVRIMFNLVGSTKQNLHLFTDQVQLVFSNIVKLTEKPDDFSKMFYTLYGLAGPVKAKPRASSPTGFPRAQPHPSVPIDGAVRPSSPTLMPYIQRVSGVNTIEEDDGDDDFSLGIITK